MIERLIWYNQTWILVTHIKLSYMSVKKRSTIFEEIKKFMFHNGISQICIWCPEIHIQNSRGPNLGILFTKVTKLVFLSRVIIYYQSIINKYLVFSYLKQYDGTDFLRQWLVHEDITSKLTFKSRRRNNRGFEDMIWNFGGLKQNKK